MLLPNPFLSQTGQNPLVTITGPEFGFILLASIYFYIFIIVVNIFLFSFEDWCSCCLLIIYYFSNKRKKKKKMKYNFVWKVNTVNINTEHVSEPITFSLLVSSCKSVFLFFFFLNWQLTFWAVSTHPMICPHVCRNQTFSILPIKPLHVFVYLFFVVFNFYGCHLTIL